MAYEEFPDEYALLRASLDNEDFDRAEPILLQILKKRPDFQQAKIDLDRVRGKIGSIGNFQFRVRAFLEEGDVKQAGVIVQEARQKFKKNKKILKLVRHYVERAGVAPPDEPAGENPKADPLALDDQTPTVDALRQDAEGLPGSPAAGLGTSPPDGAPLSQPGSDAGSGGGSASVPTPGDAPVEGAHPAAATGADHDSPADETGADLRPAVSTGDLSRMHRKAKKRAAKAQARAGSNLPMLRPAASDISRRATLGVDITMIGIAVVLIAIPLIVGVLSLSGTRRATQTTPPSTGVTDNIAAMMGNWSAVEPGERLRLVTEWVMDTNPDLDRAAYIYPRLLAEAPTDPIVHENLGGLGRWYARAHAQEGVPVPLLGTFAEASFAPEATPPGTNASDLQTDALKSAGIGLAIGLVPGLLLGLALAFGRVPLLDRALEAGWVLWFAMPSTIIAAVVGYVVLPEYGLAADRSNAAGILLGIAMVPQVAFFARMGFVNLIGASAKRALGGGVMIGLGAGILGATRMLAEGALVLGAMGPLTERPIGAGGMIETMTSIGRELMASFADLLAVGRVGESLAEQMRYAAGLELVWFLLLIALGAAAIGLILVTLGGWIGLGDGSEPAAERPGHPMQQSFHPLSLVSTALGVVLIGGAGVLFVPPLLGFGDGASIQTFPMVDLDAATSRTLSIALVGGLVATAAGALIALITALGVTGRRSRLIAEAVLRLPVALPLAVLTMLALVMLGAQDQSSGTMAGFSAALVMTPLAAALLHATWANTRRGPYIESLDGRRPDRTLLIVSRVADGLGVGGWMVAIVAGSLPLMLAFGSFVADPAASNAGLLAASPTLPAELFRLLAIGEAPGAMGGLVRALLGIVVGAVAIAFVLRLAGEATARLARFRAH